MGPARELLPRQLARRELVRALFGAGAAPFRFAAWIPRRARDRAAVRADLASPAPSFAEPDVRMPPGRALRVFVSSAEASGEIHAASLVLALRERARRDGAPEPEIVAIGGERLRALGVPVLGDPVSRARTGTEGVARALPYYVGLLEDAARHAREVRPDVFVPVDSPALHVPMARCVRAYGVPVVHLVAPQYWAWLPWRVRAYEAAVDRALTILPHEPSWFGRSGVSVAHVGHPLLDSLRGVPAPVPGADSRRLAVLPGSRDSVIRRNLPWMLGVLAEARALAPEIEPVVLQATGEHREAIEALLAGTGIPLEVGDLHARLAGARAAFAVSGTVLTDLLHHRLPAVVVYRVAKRLETWLQRHALTVPWFASTNLLAGEEVLPEHCFRGAGPRSVVARELARAFSDEAWRARCIARLDAAAERLGPPGAIERAAGHVIAVALGSRAL